MLVRIIKKFLGVNVLLVCSAVSSLAAPETVCVRQALIYGYDADLAVKLCTGASSDAPASCFRENLLVNHLTQDQALELCRPKTILPVALKKPKAVLVLSE